jgi:hypothetical protein
VERTLLQLSAVSDYLCEISPAARLCHEISVFLF